METFAVGIPGGLAKEINASAIAETAVEEVINALRSKINPVRRAAEPSGLLDVDRETNVVTVAQELFSDILGRRLAALKRQHNTMIPINSLFAEILAHIISLSVHSQPWSISALHGLASVCSRWWHIIITTPSLWATAKMFEKPELAVKKSKEVPLTVYGRFGYDSEEEVKQFIDISGPHVHRWQSVSIHGAHLGHVFPYLASPLPWLEELKASDAATSEGPLGRLTLGAAPKLRRLHLTTIAVDWESLPHLSLETLFLSHLPNYGPNIRQLYRILASSPHLTDLTLCSLPENPSDAEDFEAEVVTLEHLCRVDIQAMGQRTFAGLAGVVQARKLSTLTLKGAISSYPNTLSHLQHILRPSPKGGLLPSAIQSRALDLVYVVASEGDFVLTDANDYFTYSRTKSQIFVQFELHDVAVTVPMLILGAPGRGYDIDLNVVDWHPRGEELCRVLDLVDPLVLRIRYHNLLIVMDALSRVPAPSEKWFCPRLSHLHLHDYVPDFHSVARVLRVRNDLEEIGTPTGRSTLQLYDDIGRLIVATVSPETGGSSSQSTHSQENVEEA